jgi:hypothetical protein
MIVAGAGAVGVVMQGLPAALASLLAGGVLACAAWLFFRAINSFTPIDTREAQHRIEQAAGVSELAPLTSTGDRVASGDKALWDWHNNKLAQAATALTKPTNPTLHVQDGLRLLALCLATAICVWQPVAAARALAFDLSPLVGDGDLVLDVWAQPPEYTGLPVIRLSRDTPNIALPEGSVINARMDGATGAPKLRVPGDTVTMARERGQAWLGKATFTANGEIKLDRLGTRARWSATVVQDKPPVLIADEPIKIDPKGRLDVAFSARDDYGVASAALRVRAVRPLESLGNKAIFESVVPLEGEPDEDGARRVFVDVSDHVLTGLSVDVALVVRDGKGQEAVGPVTRLNLPVVAWKSTLGRALQEQRLSILRENRPYRYQPLAFAKLFDAGAEVPIKLDLSEPLRGAPEGIARAEQLLSATLGSIRQAGMSDVGMMGLQFARERLALARSPEEAHEVAPLLWQLAMQAEVADQSPAQQRLAAAKQALEQALKNGASEEEVASLSQELREAVGQRLEELAQQGGSGEGQGEGQSGGGDVVSSDDIDKMLRELERSGGSGARQDALDQLDKLAELMEKLQSGGQGGGEGQGGTGQSGSGAMDNAMRVQRDLTDETGQRQRQDQDHGTPAPDLAQRQNDLADRLSPATPAPKKPKAAPPEGPEAQVEASKKQAADAMREASSALRRGDLAGAQEAQSRAEQALQQAAQAQAANEGGEGNQDPLGRMSRGRDDGKETKVPDQVEKRRARDVREELRRRQADPNRDGQERDYLDRLLKDR